MENLNNYSFSFFSSIYDDAGKEFDLYELRKQTTSKSTAHFKLISKIRNTKDEEKIKELKKQIPAVSVSAIIKGKRSTKNILRHSNLIGIDLDDLENVVGIRKLLENDPYVTSLFLSPGGQGLKLIFQIDGKKHLQYFTAIAQYLNEKYYLQVDLKCKDVVRLIFLSYDPDFYLNPEAPMFPILEFLPYPAKKRTTDNGIEIQEFIGVVEEIERTGIDITADYEDWLKIGFICADLFGEGGIEYFHRISKFHPKYSVSETEKQFASCLISKRDGVTVKTFFYIAKKYGLPIVNIKLAGKSEQSSSVIDENLKFWWLKPTRNGKSLEIIYTRLNSLLLHLGFRRFDVGLNRIFVRVADKVVEEVAIHQIQDALITFIKDLPIDLGDGVTKVQLLEKIFRNPAHYFNESRLTLLHQGEKFDFNTDTQDSAFIYYQNGFVRVTSDSIELINYCQLKKYIWRNQILPRDFFKHEEIHSDKPEGNGMFSDFLLNICKKDEERYNGLLTIIGYLLHNYFDTRLRCLILTDSKISDLPEGRTGKSLISKALGHIRNYSEVDGKSFDENNRFKWQEVELSTQIVGLNDVRANFNIDMLFTAITEGIKVEQKNKPANYIKAKLIITSNRTVITDGDSRKDRCIEFELGDYYSSKYRPEHEFKCWFFKDWQNEEWLKFDNLMMNSIQQYFVRGLIMPGQINLDQRKLLELTNPDFIQFMEDKFTSGEIKVNQELIKKDLYEQFLNDYPDYQDDRILGKMRGFTNYLRIFSKYSERVAEIIPKKDERKSGSCYYITFRAPNKEGG